MSIPEDLTLFIKEMNNINSFIETGTYQGETAIWASKHFDKIVTIEFSEEIFNQTYDKYTDFKNVNFLFGDSRKCLEQILPDVQQSIIWLDAHWCSNGSYGEKDQCPLVTEIELINRFDKDHVILIDDARLFLAPPPLPNSMQYYPDLNQIQFALNQKNRAVYVYEDVIIAVPENNRQEMQKFLQQKTTESWKMYGIRIKKEEALNKSKMKKTIYYLKRLIRIWVKKSPIHIGV